MYGCGYALARGTILVGSVALMVDSPFHYRHTDESLAQLLGHGTGVCYWADLYRSGVPRSGPDFCMH